MAFIDDLAKATRQFTEATTEFATTRALGRAQEQVNQIKESELEESEKAQHLRKVAQQLTFDLQQSGTPATAIAQAAKNIAPPEPQFQSLEVAAALGDEETSTRAREILDLRDQRKLERAEAQAGFKQKAKDITRGRKFITDQIKTFNRIRKTEADATAQARNALKLLNSKDASQFLTAGAIGTLMARASREVGNLTAAERQAFEGNPSILATVKRYLSKKFTGKIPESDKEAIRALAKIYITGSEERLKADANFLASQTDAFLTTNGIPGPDANKLLFTISGKMFDRFEGSKDLKSKKQVIGDDGEVLEGAEEFEDDIIGGDSDDLIGNTSSVGTSVNNSGVE